MLIYLLKGIMCYSFFLTGLTFIPEDMLKNTVFSLNMENHFIHYHTHSMSIKNQSSNTYF